MPLTAEGGLQLVTCSSRKPLRAQSGCEARVSLGRAQGELVFSVLSIHFPVTRSCILFVTKKDFLNT